MPRRLPLEPSHPRPLRTALALAALYATVCGAYIWLSGDWAAGRAASVAELERIELWKGLGFIGATALAFFVFAAILLRRVAGQRAEILRHREALLDSERRALVGSFAASLAHDLRNTLMVMEGHAEMLREEPDPHSVAQAASELGKASESLRALAGHLVEVGRSGLPGSEAELRPSAVARDAVALARGHTALRGVHVECEVEETPPARLNAAMLQQALLNLLLNAAEARPQGRIRVRLAAEGGEALLEVHDAGPGVPPGRRAEVFEAFVSSKERGSGLGLLSVKACAEWHGGSVTVDASPLGGACFRMRLPLEGSSGPGARG